MILSDRALKNFCEEAIKYVTSRIGEQVISIHLFGSYHKGNPHDQSDIDILYVLSDNQDSSYVTFLHLMPAHFQRKFGVPIHPVIVTKTEYHNENSSEMDGFRYNREIYHAP